MRFQAELSKKDTALLESLMRSLEIHSNAELLSNLLALGDWMVAERRQGHSLASITRDGPMRELVMPILEHVAPRHELPFVELEWTSDELKEAATMLTSDPATPAEKLK